MFVLLKIFHVYCLGVVGTCLTEGGVDPSPFYGYPSWNDQDNDSIFQQHLKGEA